MTNFRYQLKYSLKCLWIFFGEPQEKKYLKIQGFVLHADCSPLLYSSKCPSRRHTGYFPQMKMQMKEEQLRNFQWEIALWHVLQVLISMHSVNFPPEKKQRKAEWKLNEKMTANRLPVKLIYSDSNTSLLRED